MTTHKNDSKNTVTQVATARTPALPRTIAETRDALLGGSLPLSRPVLSLADATRQLNAMAVTIREHRSVFRDAGFGDIDAHVRLGQMLIDIASTSDNQLTGRKGSAVQRKAVLAAHTEAVQAVRDAAHAMATLRGIDARLFAMRFSDTAESALNGAYALRAALDDFRVPLASPLHATWVHEVESAIIALEQAVSDRTVGVRGGTHIRDMGKNARRALAQVLRDVRAIGRIALWKLPAARSAFQHALTPRASRRTRTPVTPVDTSPNGSTTAGATPATPDNHVAA
jgi:hypothetical protein